MKVSVKSGWVAPDFWEEHCIECGAPACYATCEKHNRGRGGICRRFKNGIERRKDGFAIQFLSWGKLEMYWQGRLAAPLIVRLAQLAHRLCAPVVRMFGDEFLVRGLRRRATRWLGAHAVPDEWAIDCVAERDEELVLSVVNDKLEELHVERLALRPGANAFRIPLPRAWFKAGAATRLFFRLASIEGTHATVLFRTCAVRKASPSDSFHAPFVKCLAWDLDGTLWRGVLVEDGEEGVSLREDAVALVKALDARGILNTLCSKNDWNVVKPVLEKFGLLDYFVFPQVNWNPKSENIAQTAKDVNVGLDAFAFVDDSPSERGEVAERLPMVRVFRADELGRMADDPAFNPPVSDESASRRFSYLAEMVRRKDERVATGTRTDFLRSCEIELACVPLRADALDEALFRRCWELVNRTNQLTLAANRYDETSFAELVSATEACAIRCRDKYGDYGVVGFVAAARMADVVVVREFVMSCRVAKKLCEQSALLFLADRFRAAGCRTMAADVVKTGRNHALVEAFDAMPFAKRAAGEKRWRYELELGKADCANVFRNRCVWTEG